jgi:uncharacterized phage protein gp47/JayE
MTIPITTIDAAGVHKPAFSAVLAGIVSSYQVIYGSDVVLTPDTQDGQFLGIVATAIDELNALAVAVYNQFSPATSQGVGLSSVVKINGLERDDPTNSTAVLLLVGQQGTEINNGFVIDTLNNNWNLPASVTIPFAGQISVTATCQTPGAVQAAPGTLTKMGVIVPGWQTVTNPQAATPGAPVQTDAQLRITQSLATAIPALSVVGGLQGALLSLPGVQTALVFENDTDTVDANGLPSGSISCVVAGGNLQDIINTIGVKKGPGVGTFGNTVGTFVDTAGTPRQVAYFVPIQVPIAVQITLNSLNGYTTDVQSNIAQVVTNFINALAGDQNVIRGRLFVPANLSGSAAFQFYLAQTTANGNPSNPAGARAQLASDANTFELLDIQLSRGGQAVADADVVIAFNETATCTVDSVQFVLNPT